MMKRGKFDGERFSGKRGQIKLSFGMIFSIFLIIIFVSFAFYAIYKFLDIQEGIEIGRFVDGVQHDVDKMWKSTQGSQVVEYRLAKDVEYVCFVDYSNPKAGSSEELYDHLKQNYYEYENLFFYPISSAGELNAFEIKHIDIQKMTKSQNPYCIESSDGKIEMTIKKKLRRSAGHNN